MTIVYSKKQHTVCVGDNDVQQYAMKKISKEDVAETILHPLNLTVSI